MQRFCISLLFGVFALLTHAVAQPSFIVHSLHQGYLIVEAPYGSTGYASVVIQTNTAENIRVVGLEEAAFSVTPTELNLAAGDTATVTFAFTPQGYLTVSDTVYFEGNSGRTSLFVVGTVDTTTISDRMSIASAVNFGTVGSSSVVKNLTIYSRVAEDVTVSLSMSDGPFSINETMVTVPGMTSHGRIDVPITYDGTATTHVSSLLTIEDIHAPSGVRALYEVRVTARQDTSHEDRVRFDLSAYNAIIPDNETSVTFPVYLLNATDQSISDVELVITGSMASYFSVSPATFSAIHAGEKQEILVTASRHEDLSRFNAGLFVSYRNSAGDSMATVTLLIIGQNVTHEAPKILPDFHHFGSNTTPGDTRRAHFTVVNHTHDTVIVSRIESTSEDVDIVFYIPVLPVVLYPSDSISIDLECTTTGTGMITGSLIAYCSKDGFVTSEILAVANYICGDTLLQRPVEVHVSTSSPTPTTIAAHLRTLSPIPDVVMSCVVSVEYDASVITPLSPREGADVTLSNLTTSQFRLETPGHRPGSLLGSISFTRTSTGSSPVTVTNVTWYDAKSEIVDLATKGNGTTVNVLEGGERGYSLSPMPIAGLTTVRTPASADVTSVTIYDVVGRQRAVGTMTAHGLWQFDAQSLDKGMYVVVITTTTASYSLVTTK
ncbi:MAG TPA: hypothetical protein DIS79_03740 [Bacteroidetes bacterium]|nr:hypothetical protein [Bacteroidota bacterium]HRK05039.1 T9SS type A sorting domain-containing protein [Chlorobiota bacterium]